MMGIAGLSNIDTQRHLLTKREVQLVVAPRGLKLSSAHLPHVQSRKVWHVTLSLREPHVLPSTSRHIQIFYPKHIERIMVAGKNNAASLSRAATQAAPKLPPLPKLKVRRPDRADANPCIGVMTSVLGACPYRLSKEQVLKSGG